MVSVVQDSVFGYADKLILGSIFFDYVLHICQQGAHPGFIHNAMLISTYEEYEPIGEVFFNENFLC